MIAGDGLTDKQEAFCVEYLKDFNATRAALAAGYSSKTARQSASENLKKPNIQARLSELRTATGRATAVTLERVVQELGHVAFSRFTDVARFDNGSMTLKDSATLPDEVLAAIDSVSVTETVTDGSATVKQSLKMHNKIAALKILGTFFGIDSDFNQARASLKKYGLALVEDPGSKLGWKLDEYDPNTANPYA